MPAPARAAEVVVREPDGAVNEVAVEQGKAVPFRLEVSAAGNIACATRPRPSTARLDTNVSVNASGGTSRYGLSSPLRFYAQAQPPPGPCAVTWDNAPEPYVVNATLAADRRAPVGVYHVAMPAQTADSVVVDVFPGLEDRQVFVLRVKVIAPLAPPAENDSVNVYPSVGSTLIKTPGQDYKLLTEPTHIPVRSLLNTTDGHAFLVSDSDGPVGLGTQQVEVWAGYLRVQYSRSVFERRARAGNPITELRVTGPTGKRMVCRRSRGARSARRRRIRRRRLWGRGRGRFRSRTRHISGSVRGTTWYTEETCLGSLVRVSDGTVRVRDFVIDQTFRVRAGQGYFAARRRSVDGRN